MKVAQLIAPLATLSLALAHGEKAKYTDSTPVSFSQDGISNIVNVATKSSEGDATKVITSVMDFFKRNPQVLKSIMTEANKPEHSEAKNKAINMAMEIYSKTDNIDLHKTGLDAIKYAYKNPKFFNLVQKAGIQAMKDSPTLVDDFFAQAEKAVAEDPSLVSRAKDYLIDFSHDEEDIYKQGYELALKSALINPAFSSHLLVHILQVDRIGCKGAVEGGCDCKKSGEYSNGGATKPAKKEAPKKDSTQEESSEPAENEVIEESYEPTDDEIPEESSNPVGNETTEDYTEPTENDFEDESPELEDYEGEISGPVEGEGNSKPTEKDVDNETPEPTENEAQVEDSVPEEDYNPSTEAEEPISYSRPAYPIRSSPGNYNGGSVKPSPRKSKDSVRKAPKTVRDAPTDAKSDKYKVSSAPANKPAY